MSSSTERPRQRTTRRLVALCLLLSAPTGTGAMTTCDQAAALADARLLTPLHDACVALAKDEQAAPCKPCADLSGLAEAIGEARGHLARGESLQATATTQTEAARRAFVAALAIDDSLAAARDALTNPPALGDEEGKKELPADTEENDELRQIQDLVSVGAIEAARNKMNELVSQHAGLAQQAREDSKLKHLADGRLPWWRDLLHDAAPWAKLVLEVLALLLVLLAALRTPPPLRRWLMRWLKPNVRIGEIKTAGSAGEIGSAFAAVLGSGLTQPPSVGSTPYNMVTQSIGVAEQLPQGFSTSVPTQLSLFTVLPAALSWLSFRREILVEGTLYENGARAPEATLTISEDKRILATERFSASDLAVAVSHQGDDDQSVFYRLAERASVWLMFALERARNGRELVVNGTTDWKSYALFRAGLRAEGVLRD